MPFFSAIFYRSYFFLYRAVESARIMTEATEEQTGDPASDMDAELVVGSIISDIIDRLGQNEPCRSLQHLLPQFESETINAGIVVGCILTEILDGIGRDSLLEQSGISSSDLMNKIIAVICEEVFRDEEECQIKIFGS
jgi:hypothetical protein